MSRDRQDARRAQMSFSFRALLALVLLLSPATLIVPYATPALAHPFGPPPTAVVSAAGNTVTIQWRAAIDDMLAIGERLGVLPPGTAEGYREAAVQVAPPAAAEETLDRSPELAEYLQQRLTVTQHDGQDSIRCDFELVPVVSFLTEGAVTRHHCPKPVATVTLNITMLHDIHEAYRTFAIDRTEGVKPGQSVHTVTAPAAEWEFGAVTTPNDTSSTGGWWPLIAILMLGAAAALAVRRRSRT